MSTKYQTIVEMPAGTDISTLPEVFQGLSQAFDINDLSQRPMPGTRDFNGKMLVHMEIKNITAAAQAMQLLAAGISGALGQTWTLVHAQAQNATPQVDGEGNPIMIGDTGEETQLIAVVPDVQMTAADFINYMEDIDEIGTRPTEAVPHKFAGSADWVLG